MALCAQPRRCAPRRTANPAPARRPDVFMTHPGLPARAGRAPPARAAGPSAHAQRRVDAPPHPCPDRSALGRAAHAPRIASCLGADGEGGLHCGAVGGGRWQLTLLQLCRPSAQALVNSWNAGWQSRAIVESDRPATQRGQAAASRSNPSSRKTFKGSSPHPCGRLQGGATPALREQRWPRGLVAGRRL